MIRRGTRLVAALAAAVLLAVAVSACGGSGSGTSSSTSASAGASEKGAGKGGEASPEKGQAGDGEGGSGEGGSDGSSGGGQTRRQAPVAPLKVSGGGSGQFRVEGGDNSIQDFGEEGDEGELEEAARVLHDFYVARAEKDWSAACARLSKSLVRQLETLAAQAKSGDKSCPTTLAALTPPLSPAVQRETTVVDAGSLRVEGDRGFLIYRGAGKTVYAINMAHEGGWKVAALSGVPLS